ncbi:MAG: phosphate acyltransferase PlsX [Puniceicoccales bacterium]|jgi:glycerol-3-phosphate acyltransferase PlsX|nr:phosphate acyltransferase PlsX [Puniceicoccales bacterium]
MVSPSADTRAYYRIAVDCMGGDKGPAEVVRGVKLALNDVGPEDRFILVGKEKWLRSLVKKTGLEGHPRIEIRNADEVISMDDKPMQALKSKKDASMMVAFDMVKQGEADAVFSTGNTKVLVGAGAVKLRLIPGADRPALVAIMPHTKGYFVLLDVGANPESTPRHLMHNAVMGTIYAQAALGIERPRLGLLTVGTEEGKGGARINNTHTLLKKLGDEINYVGPMEGFDMFEGNYDVVIVDGFTGNILLKTAEGMFSMLQRLVKEKLRWNPLYLLGATALLPVANGVKEHLSSDRNGGAPLLGLSALVMKAHGSGNRHAIRGTIRLGREALSKQMSYRLEHALTRANEIVAETEVRNEAVPAK